MAEVFLSPLVGTMLDSLNSWSSKGLELAGSLKAEVESLESTLTTIQAVLQDAEKKQSKSHAINDWLGKLKQAAYDLEVVLDDFNTEALRRSLHTDARSQVTTFFSLRNPLLFRLDMARKFKNVREKLDAIAGEKSKFHLREGVGEAEIERNEDRQTSSLVKESEVLGRADEKEKIVSMLLSNVSHRDDLSVYAICGMGGLGKTTIAQLVYNDENVAKVFDLRGWVCVSNDFDIKRLTKAIVESFGGKSGDIQELDPLQRCLVEKLVGKRFLLVLDDVWNEYDDKWDRLKQALQCGRKGSAVMVTTRLEKVALMMATTPFYRLGCLSDDDSWSLFKRRAFGMGTNGSNANLETIGRQIVQRCGGVPLAIKAVGSILRFRSQESEWLRVKDSEIWDLEDEGGRILAVLRLSYEHLPPYMRQCFSFCSIFPKDSVMTKDKLIGLWMANGFIPSRGALDLHDMGCEIFSDLTRRSFFQEIEEYVDGTVTCKMHDLIHDLATSIMGQECCVVEPNEGSQIPKTARHLFVYNSSPSTNIMDLTTLQPLQSLILGSYHVKLSNPSPFFSKQKYLKVLDFGFSFSNIAFKSSKHLRYLCLRCNHVKALPESTSSLHNLQTLNLKGCHNLEMLPKGTKNLKNLRYLDIRGCWSLTSTPVALGQLSLLRKLSMFIVGKEEGCGIDELKELALEGELSIKGLHNVKSSMEAKKANLIKKHNLRSLSLSWRVCGNENSHHQNDEEILSALQPHSNLKKLCIIDYQGLMFPYWMMDLLLPNLVEISLENCERCHQLPPLGKLRFLKVLNIGGMGALKYIDNNFYGDMERSFPSLEVLGICGAPCLEEWTTVNGTEHLPLLSSLTIRSCPKLVKLPMLQSLKELRIGGTNVNLLAPLIMNATVLTSLRISDFNELPGGLLQNQKQLDRLGVLSCSLKSSSDLLDNLSSLKDLDIEGSSIESLPAGLQNLSSLRTLYLNCCDSLVSLPVNGLEGLSSLFSLTIQNCKTLASLSEGVGYLTSLRHLLINGCPELTSLPRSIQHLSSLQRLQIWQCGGLISLPDEIQHLTLLSLLEIKWCSNLMTLPPGVRNLNALQKLRIVGCPHLQRRCKKLRGEDWPNIAHIPTIQIVDKVTIYF
ncbi:disease resistance protein RGA2-like [Gossypium australe]|uniref:Disease resistance protein RGA2-like n=1 Tax=Gossypium australe TaxID=47621 RepID=A0A5B6W591_9ROSI|nr:disease resistance protein RGA2-like [Gossypium australe]